MRSSTIIATPPGATIREQLIDRGMKQKEFARRMDMSEKHISRLINGEVQLTPDVAMRLEMVLGVPAQFWSGLESIYREKLVKATSERDMDADIELAKKFPYNEMSKNDWVPKTSQSKEKVINLRKYFEVVRLDLIQDTLPLDFGETFSQIMKQTDYRIVCEWAQKATVERETSIPNPSPLINFPISYQILEL